MLDAIMDKKYSLIETERSLIAFAQALDVRFFILYKNF